MDLGKPGWLVTRLLLASSICGAKAGLFASRGANGGLAMSIMQLTPKLLLMPPLSQVLLKSVSSNPTGHPQWQTFQEWNVLTGVVERCILSRAIFILVLLPDNHTDNLRSWRGWKRGVPFPTRLGIGTPGSNLHFPLFELCSPR